MLSSQDQARESNIEKPKEESLDISNQLTEMKLLNGLNRNIKEKFCDLLKYLRFQNKISNLNVIDNLIYNIF